MWDQHLVQFEINARNHRIYNEQPIENRGFDESHDAALLEQYLLARLHELLYSSLLAENQARLEHLESAVQRLERKSGSCSEKRNVVRQEEITEEIEVIMLGAEMMI